MMGHPLTFSFYHYGPIRNREQETHEVMVSHNGWQKKKWNFDKGQGPFT